MNPERSSTYSKSERGRMNRTRHLSDHELLFNGADYDGDRLTPTKDQINEIWHEHQTNQQVSDSIEVYKIPVFDDNAARNVGHQALVLHDPVREELKKSPDDLEREAVNRRALLDKIHDITEPYIGLFNDKVPQPNSNKRTAIRKRLKTDTSASEPWEVSKPVGNFDATFKTTLFYKPGEDHNTLERASIRIKRKGSEDTSIDDAPRVQNPVLHVNYSPDGRVVSLAVTRLYDSAGYQGVFGHAPEPHNAVGEFVDVVVPILKDTGYGYDVSIDLAGTPAVKVSLRTVHMGTGVKLSTLCEYKYDPDTDAFRLYDNDPSFERPTSMSVEDYMELVQDTLNIIPVTKTEY